MTRNPLRLLSGVAALVGALACIYLLLAFFSGRSGCVLPDVFAPGCSSAWKGASPLVTGVLFGVGCLVWLARGSDRSKTVAAVMGLVYAAAVFVLFLGYVGTMAGAMH
jgi:hypothetical protein